MMVEMDLSGQIRKFVKRYPALSQAERVAVAVSGGGDSVALAVAAHQVWPNILLLHVNYGLRGDESEKDEALLRELATRLGVQLEVQRVQPKDRSEETLRDLRYAWFHQCPVDAVLTAHTCEDQAETMLFRIVRGTGLSGLAGILPVSSGRYYRPFLNVSREQIREWLREHEIAWREDASNLDLSYRRNWIRHELMPALRREINPETDQALAQLAGIALDEEAWATLHAATTLDPLVSADGQALVLHCEPFNTHPVAVRRRMMRELLERVKDNLREIDFAHVEAALQLCTEQEGNGRIQVPGLDLMRSFGWLRVIRLEVLRDLPERNFRLAFPFPGEVSVPEDAGTLSSQVDSMCNYNESGGSLDLDRVLAAMDAERRLELRNWRPGDSYTRAGASGPEKVKELFQKFRIPLWRRRSWPIIVLGDLPIWVAGFGPAAEFAITPESRTALRIQWKPFCPAWPFG
ncbi:MAG: tRNA lysidine(34) synthetase TilS [Acidobacteria bacterium]|nr:tRNA lysidine(34) synthetase TilS [Acidobacteriota bacterium]